MSRNAALVLVQLAVRGPLCSSDRQCEVHQRQDLGPGKR